MKLAKAAAQQLKGVIVEYDVLCSTLIGRSTAEQAAQQQRARAAAALHAQSQQKSVGERVAAVGSMLLTDVRAMLRDAGQDTTGKPWVARDRLQSVLQGLPAQCTPLCFRRAPYFIFDIFDSDWLTWLLSMQT